jgi:hypothetical protein
VTGIVDHRANAAPRLGTLCPIKALLRGVHVRFAGARHNLHGQAWLFGSLLGIA